MGKAERELLLRVPAEREFTASEVGCGVQYALRKLVATGYLESSRRLVERTISTRRGERRFERREVRMLDVYRMTPEGRALRQGLDVMVTGAGR